MELDTDLLASIASGGLGHWLPGAEGQQAYQKDDDCVACLKDLQRFLRFDDPDTREAFFAVSKYNLTRSDLVPLIVTYPDDYEVVYNAIKVCTLLTMPWPRSSLTGSKFDLAQVASCHIEVCQSFLVQDALAVVLGLLADPLMRHPRMNDRDGPLVELIITFIRNLLIGLGPTGIGLTDSARAIDANRVKVDLVSKLLDEDFLELFLNMAQHAREQPFKSQAPVLLEIFLSVLVDTVPERLLHQHSKEHEQEELNDHLQSSTRFNSPRASASAKLGATTFSQKGPTRYQFSNAVYVRRHQDSTSTTIVRHKPNSHELPRIPSVLNARQAKAEVKDAAMSKILGVTDNQVTKQVKALAWRLEGFIDRFLDEAYTPLVGLIFKNARPGLNVSEYDEQIFENFVRLVAFCTKHVRLREEKRIQWKEQGSGTTAEGDNKSPFECLSTTISWEAFQMVQSLLESAAVAEIQFFKHNRKAPLRATSLLKSVGDMLREMLLVLDLARAVGNSTDKHAAVRLQQRLVYHEGKDWGLVGTIVRSIKEYSYQAHSRSHAVNLVEVFHIAMMTQDAILKKQQGGTGTKSSNSDEEATGTGAENPQEVEWNPDAAHWFRRNCAQPAVLQFYTWLLQGYATNSDFTNNAILDYLQRIVLPTPRGLGLQPMLWQLSVLRLFYSIMSDPLVRKQSKFAPLLQLCKTTVRNLFDRLVVKQPPDDQIDEQEEMTIVQRCRKQIPKQIENEVKRECAGLGFIELLFWKNPSSAEIIADEYNWKRALDEVGNRQGAIDGDDGDVGQLAFASFRGNDKGVAPPEYFEEIRSAFETCNGMKNCLDTLVEKLGGRLTKQQISSSLRHLGLKRGCLTVAQEEVVRSVYRQHFDEKIKRICEIAVKRLNAGFNVRQMHSQLVKLGLIPGKGKPSNGPSRTNWDDVLGSEDDFDDHSPAQTSSPPSSAAKRKAFDDLVKQWEEENGSKEEQERDEGESENISKGPTEAGYTNANLNEDSEEERIEDMPPEVPAPRIPEGLQKLLQARKANGTIGPPQPTVEEIQTGKENEGGSRRLKKKRSDEETKRMDPGPGPLATELDDF